MKTWQWTTVDYCQVCGWWSHTGFPVICSQCGNRRINHNTPIKWRYTPFCWYRPLTWFFLSMDFDEETLPKVKGIDDD